MAMILSLAGRGEGASGRVMTERFPSGRTDSWCGKREGVGAFEYSDAFECVDDGRVRGCLSTRGVRLVVLCDVLVVCSMIPPHRTQSARPYHSDEQRSV